MKVSKTGQNTAIIYTPNATFLQSYDSIVVKTTFEDGERVVYLGPDYNYSKTTAKHVNQFLGTTAKEFHAKVKSGEYKVIDNIEKLTLTLE